MTDQTSRRTSGIRLSTTDLDDDLRPIPFDLECQCEDPQGPYLLSIEEGRVTSVTHAECGKSHAGHDLAFELTTHEPIPVDIKVHVERVGYQSPEWDVWMEAKPVASTAEQPFPGGAA